METFTLEQVALRGHNIGAPFALDVMTGKKILIESILRILPGKRIVTVVQQDGKKILAKVFFHQRNYEDEIKGYDRIKKTAAKTPMLLEHFQAGKGGVCFYEFLEGVQSFSEMWETGSEETKPGLLDRLLDLLQDMYSAKLYQSDLHLGNFVIASGMIFALDPASMKTLGDDAASGDNLALLLAQFPLRDWPIVQTAIQQRFPAVQQKVLVEKAKDFLKKRRREFLQKIYRECTYIHTWCVNKKMGQHLNIYAVRKQCYGDMPAILEKINVLPSSANVLKNGNSSVVFSLDVNGKKIVIKNSRNKDIWRLLRRCLRRSRASNSWYFAHLLRDAGIHVPAPIALVERKWGPFVLESWFVSEGLEADNLLDVWLYQLPTALELSEIKNIFASLKSLHLVHGDMKATNLLLANEKIYLIDYDGMGKGTPRNAKKDLERFLENWPDSDWKQSLRAHLENNYA